MLKGSIIRFINSNTIIFEQKYIEMKKISCILFVSILGYQHTAQIEQSQIGACYMCFFNYQFKVSQFGVMGDLQYRNWNIGGDLEQLLIRTGFTFTQHFTTNFSVMDK